MKRGLLIGVGTLGGLGAVFAITPPQFGSSAGVGGIPTSSTGTKTTTATQEDPAQSKAASTPAPVATKATASKKKRKRSTAAKSTHAESKNTTATQSNSTQSTQAPAETKTPTNSSSGTSGTFAGATSQTRYGPVQVQITVLNGKITAAKALQYPNGDYRSADISSQAIPFLVSETLAAQSAKISGVGGASYTSYGWYQSLQSALAKAGM
jgi:uncharacterized protein with FMN-binding domain